MNLTMNNCRVFLLAALSVCPAGAFSAEHELLISVSNSLPQMRSEMVEVDASELPKTPFVIKDGYGAEVPYQLTHDGKIVFPVSVGPSATSVFTVSEGKPAKVDKVTFAAFYPERIDDIAWENDYSAYRAYGPASNDEVSGYDAWTKSTTRPVVAERYFNELVKRVSYHVDHGDGMDQYEVGATLGAGASAPMGRDGNLILPGAFTKWKILDNGPLRTTIELVYEYGGGRDVRTITLDAGTPFNHTVSRLEGFDVDSIAAGVVVHKPAVNDFVLGERYVAYSDPSSAPSKNNGKIFVGVVCQDKCSTDYRPISKESKKGVGHALAIAPYRKGGEFSYYWGSSWSKGRTPTFNRWICEIEDFQRCLNSPLKIDIKR